MQVAISVPSAGRKDVSTLPFSRKQDWLRRHCACFVFAAPQPRQAPSLASASLPTHGLPRFWSCSARSFFSLPGASGLFFSPLVCRASHIRCRRYRPMFRLQHTPTRMWSFFSFLFTDGSRSSLLLPCDRQTAFFLSTTRYTMGSACRAF